MPTTQIPSFIGSTIVVCLMALAVLVVANLMEGC
jgi:hypothetical protein